MSTVVLNHYSNSPLWQLHSVEQDENSGFGQIGKPQGLWLSDCTDYGWAKWCLAEGFRLDKLLVRTRCVVEVGELLVIDNPLKMVSFNNQFGMSLGPSGTTMQGIDWGAVSSAYKGIVITPYRWEYRLEGDFFWYYGWDCASACVWDTSCITDREIDADWCHSLEELQEMHEKGYEDDCAD